MSHRQVHCGAGQKSHQGSVTNLLKAAGAEFCEEPREEAYGTVVVFQDLYGNKWDLLQLSR